MYVCVCVYKSISFLGIDFRNLYPFSYVRRYERPTVHPKEPPMAVSKLTFARCGVLEFCDRLSFWKRDFRFCILILIF